MASGKTRRSVSGPYAKAAGALWRRRRKLGLTQKDAASALQISLRDLRRIESGAIAPNEELRAAIATLLRASQQSLFAGLPPDNAWPRRGRKKGSRSTGHPIDLHVGSRLYQRRIEMGFSQERLAEALGVSFQQVQKYERGANRISASRLYDISRALQVTMSYFFDEIPAVVASDRHGGIHAWQDEPAAYEPDRTEAKELGELLGAFRSIHSTELRRHLIDLARAIARLDSDTLEGGD